MAEQNQKSSSLFRKEALEHVASPDHLTEYLKVTNPGIWAVLGAVCLLLAGILIWSLVGTLDTRVDATIVVKDQKAQVITTDARPLQAGMPLQINGQKYTLTEVESDTFGRLSGLAAVDLPDGTYEGQVTVDSVRPIDFLLKSQ